MTNTDYRNLVSQIRYHYTCLVQTLVQSSQYGISIENHPREKLMKKIGLYLKVLENYVLPVKVIGTSATSGTTISLSKTVTPSDYNNWLYHTISGDGVPENTLVTRVESDTFYLSKACTSSNVESIYTIGENCISESQFNCIISDINECLGTDYCVNPYYTEFDLNLPASTIPDTTALLYGSSALVLTGSTIEANLSSTTFTGADTDVTYTFTLEYPYFAYPSTYPDLSQILDQEGDDVLAAGAFQKYLIDVEFPGEDDTVQYKVYRTGYITTIPGETYSFKF